MSHVTHILDALPLNEHIIRLQRREDLLLTMPSPTLAMNLWQGHEHLLVTHFPHHWEPAKFAPPRDIFASNSLRLEWQQMNNRQPFYHRNADVDEISYQVDGERTLITELGTVELRSGDFSRIPVGIAHDNYGRKEVHVLVYIHAPVSDEGRVDREAEARIIPFDGWTPNPSAIEMMTECLAAAGCDIAVSQVDEQLLLHGGLEAATDPGAKIVVQRPVAKDSEVEWLYKSAKVWVGNVKLSRAKGDIYRTHRRATAIHCQISGTRVLVTQRGTIELKPGDYIGIPRGTAYTSLCAEDSSHIVILVADEDVVMKADVTKQAELSSVESVATLRASIQARV